MVRLISVAFMYSLSQHLPTCNYHSQCLKCYVPRPDLASCTHCHDTCQLATTTANVWNAMLCTTSRSCFMYSLSRHLPTCNYHSQCLKCYVPCPDLASCTHCHNTCQLATTTANVWNAMYHVQILLHDRCTLLCHCQTLRKLPLSDLFMVWTPYSLASCRWLHWRTCLLLEMITPHLWTQVFWRPNLLNYYKLLAVCSHKHTLIPSLRCTLSVLPPP